MTNWSEIAKALKLISSHWECKKSSDGTIEISFTNDNEIFVEIYAYGSQTMNRHHRLGPFDSEEKANKATCDVLFKEAVELINYLQDEGRSIFEIPLALHT